VDREVSALESVRDVYTASHDARTALENRIAQWQLYREGLTAQVLGYAQVRAGRLGAPLPRVLPETPAQRRYSTVIPDLHRDVKGTQFYLERSDGYRAYLEANPDALTELGLGPAQTRGILNFVNGQRSVSQIRNQVAAITGTELELERVAAYLDILEQMGWVVIRR